MPPRPQAGREWVGKMKIFQRKIEPPANRGFDWLLKNFCNLTLSHSSVLVLATRLARSGRRGRSIGIGHRKSPVARRRSTKRKCKRNSRTHFERFLSLLSPLYGRMDCALSGLVKRTLSMIQPAVAVKKVKLYK